MRSSSIPLTSLDSRTSSSYWVLEHKKDFDPSATIDQSVFDDAEEDETACVPTSSRHASGDSSSTHKVSVEPSDRQASADSTTDASSIRPASIDSLLRFQSSDYGIPSTESSRAPSNDSYLQSLIAATALYEQASRMASGESNAPVPSADSIINVPTTELTQRTVSGSMFQALMASISQEKNSSNSNDRMSTYDQITREFLSEDQPAAPKTPDATASKSPKKVAAKPTTQHAYLPPGSKNKQNRAYVTDVQELDVLCGRGGRSNHHYGNKKYRQVVSEMKEGYRGIAAKTAKTDLSRQIVDHVLEYGGRFLKRETGTGRYYVLRHDEARKKTSQALRETKVLKWTIDGEGRPITV